MNFIDADFKTKLVGMVAVGFVIFSPFGNRASAQPTLADSLRADIVDLICSDLECKRELSSLGGLDSVERVVDAIHLAEGCSASGPCYIPAAKRTDDYTVSVNTPKDLSFDEAKLAPIVNLFSAMDSWIGISSNYGRISSQQYVLINFVDASEYRAAPEEYLPN